MLIINSEKRALTKRSKNTQNIRGLKYIFPDTAKGRHMSQERCLLIFFKYSLFKGYCQCDLFNNDEMTISATKIKLYVSEECDYRVTLYFIKLRNNYSLSSPVFCFLIIIGISWIALCQTKELIITNDCREAC